MKNTILITGANSGLGKEAARQAALKDDTKKVILACRNIEKAKEAKVELELKTGKKVFEILIIDVADLESVHNAVARINEPINSVILNAGGMGGKTPQEITNDGVTLIVASNLLGHTVFVEELIKKDLIKDSVLLAGSEAARGVKNMGIKKPEFVHNKETVEDIIQGRFYKESDDVMNIYATVKYLATLWMNAMARRHSNIKFVTMSPGSTSGTNAMDNLPLVKRLMFKYVAMPVLLPMFGMAHSLETGAKRYLDGISKEQYRSGVFYASKEKSITGDLVDQSTIDPAFNNQSYQDMVYDVFSKRIDSVVA